MWEGKADKEIWPKSLTNLSAFQTPNTQFQVHNLKKQEGEIVEQPHIRPTNILMKCGYPWD